MITKQAPVNYTKLYVNDNKNKPAYSSHVKVGNSKVYFERFLNRTLPRLTKLFDACNAGLKEFNKWYYWNDGIALICVHKKFMAIYTGSVVYGILVEEESEEDSNKRLEENQYNLYYKQAEKWFNTNQQAILAINYRNQRVINESCMTEYNKDNYINTYNHNIDIINKSINSQAWKDAYTKVYREAIESINNNFIN